MAKTKVLWQTLWYYVKKNPIDYGKTYGIHRELLNFDLQCRKPKTK